MLSCNECDNSDECLLLFSFGRDTVVVVDTDVLELVEFVSDRPILLLLLIPLPVAFSPWLCLLVVVAVVGVVVVVVVDMIGG